MDIVKEKSNGCLNYANISSSSICAGGIVGMVKIGSITKCGNNAKITSQYRVGGICGELDSGLIDLCYNKGDGIECQMRTGGSSVAGGIVGWMYSASGTSVKLTNSYNIADVTATGNNVGGVVGVSGNSGSTGNTVVGTISRVYNSGIVKGKSSVRWYDWRCILY